MAAGIALPMRVLVLGGTGFVGSALVGRLQAEGHRVAMFHRTRTTGCADPGPFVAPCIHGDRGELEKFSDGFTRFGPEVVVDTIAASAPSARRTLRLFSGIARRVVLLSSMDVYRAWGVFQRSEPGGIEDGSLDESSPLRQRVDLYSPSFLTGMRRACGWLEAGYDKLGMEWEAAAWRRCEVTVVRLAPVFGPGDGQRRLWPICRRMRDARRSILMQRDWAEWRSPRGYVENVAAGIALAACHERAAGRVFNLAGAINFSEAEWVMRVGCAWGWGGRVVVMAPEHLPAHLRVRANTSQALLADSGRIRRELGYREVVGLEAALSATLAWEESQAPPPGALGESQADYASEDAALRWLGMATEVGTLRHPVAFRRLLPASPLAAGNATQEARSTTSSNA